MASDVALSRYSSVRDTPKASRTRAGVYLRSWLYNSATARKILLSLVLCMTRSVGQLRLLMLLSWPVSARTDLGCCAVSCLGCA